MPELNHENPNHECRFLIADICVRVIFTDPKLKHGTEQARQDFVVNETHSHSIVFADTKDSLDNIPGEPIFDSGALWKLYFQENQYHFSFLSPVLGPEPYKIASFSEDFTFGQILINRGLCRPDQNVDPLEYPLDELLILHLLSQGLGVEVHACGLIDSDGN
jgi:hypothetical protein